MKEGSTPTDVRSEGAAICRALQAFCLAVLAVERCRFNVRVNVRTVCLGFGGLVLLSQSHTVAFVGGALSMLLVALAALRWIRTRGDDSGDMGDDKPGYYGGQLDVRPMEQTLARYRALVDATTGVLWSVDSAGALVYGGVAFHQYTGLETSADAYAWTKAIHDMERARFASEWKVGVAGRRSFRAEARFFSVQHGYHRSCSIQAAPVGKHDGATFEWVVTLRDIEDERQSERERREIERRAQEAQRMESLGVLAGGVAHDFNNLLVGIMGHAEWLSRRLEHASPMQDNLQRIVASAERAAQLCKQMLAFAGRGRFLVEPCSVSTLAKDLHGTLASLVPAGTRLVLQLQPQLAPVEADPAELKQVLLSLVTNSAEAFEGYPGGTIAVSTGSRFFTSTELMRTKLGARCIEGEYVFLEVRDDGPGIPADVLPRIFDPFFSTKFMGRGLSLAAVLGIARSHRGTVDVSSAPGAGTTVRVMLPALLSGALAAKTPPPASRNAKGTVLVVDDDTEVRELARLTLEDVGVRVVLASHGDEAVEVFRELHANIDLVLLDLTMPGTDSATTLRALRRVSAGVQVVLSSGYLPGEAMERLGGTDVDGFVQKPWRPSELVDKLSGILVQKRSGSYRVA